MTNIAICDSTPAIDQTELAIVTALFDENELNIDLYDIEDELIQSLLDNGCHYDIVFLRVELGNRAFDIANAIRTLTIETEIVFTSTNPNFVFDSFRFKPFDYLILPIQQQKMLQLIDRYKNYHDSQSDEYFSFKIGSVNERIKLKNILYFYSNGRKIVIVTPSNSYEFYSKLDDVESLLAQDNFIRTHQSYLVNSLYIKYVMHNDVVLENDAYLPISRNRLKMVRDAYVKNMR